MTTMDIRLADSGDIEDLKVLYDRLDDLHLDYMPEDFIKPDQPFRDADFFERLLGFEENLVLVAVIEDQLVAFIEAYKMEGMANGPKRARTWMQIENVCVLPEWEGRGIASALVEEVHYIAQVNGMDAVELKVYDFNQGALAFYEALGYRPLYHWMRIPLNEKG